MERDNGTPAPSLDQLPESLEALDQLAESLDAMRIRLELDLDEQQLPPALRARTEALHTSVLIKRAHLDGTRELALRMLTKLLQSEGEVE
jgi:hypothetical protein